MDPLRAERRIAAFKAADAFAIDAFGASRWLRGEHARSLAGELRRVAVASGGAIVAASAAEPGGEQERRQLQRARVALIEGRYYLYLARRFGLIDLKRYRALTLRQDAALRELDAVLREPRGAAIGEPARGP